MSQIVRGAFCIEFIYVAYSRVGVPLDFCSVSFAFIFCNVSSSSRADGLMHPMGAASCISESVFKSEVLLFVLRQSGTMVLKPQCPGLADLVRNFLYA